MTNSQGRKLGRPSGGGTTAPGTTQRVTAALPGDSHCPRAAAIHFDSSLPCPDWRCHPHDTGTLFDGEKLIRGDPGK